MLIQDAIRARTADKSFIVREKWLKELGAYGWKGTKVLPTSTPDRCLIFTGYSRVPCRGWEPSAEDLLAEDWTISD